MSDVSSINEADYARFVQTVDKYPYTINENADLLLHASGLASEAGEVLGKVRKIFRDDKECPTPSRREAIRKEMGDVLWYFTILCSDFGWSIEELRTENFNKLADRETRGVLLGDGDDR
jgi:NTP pyrophosphatase (non-canonical NTP hydrolase)